MAFLIITTGPNAGAAFKLDRHPLVAGREANRDIQVLDPKVSRRHFAIRPNGDEYEIVEQNATNGVYINGRRIGGKATLADGDRILIGETQLVFIGSDDAAAAMRIDAIMRMRQLSPASRAPTMAD